MTYNEYLAWHKSGDGNPEERMVAKITRYLHLSEWDAFRFLYYYVTTYHLPSTFKLSFERNVKESDLFFRTDRRYVRCNGAYPRIMAALSSRMLLSLQRCRTTQQAYDEVMKWYFFGRYATTLLLEIYMGAFAPQWVDDVRFGWEKKENYTKGAVYLAGTDDHKALDSLLERLRADTNDNSYALETTLCGLHKLNTGKIYVGYATERMLKLADEDKKYGHIIYACL